MRWLHGLNNSPRHSFRCRSPAAGRTSRALPHGHAAWHLFSALTPISWKPPHGCTTSATRPTLPRRACPALDGARYLRDVQDADAMLRRLVAHHSCAGIEAEERGLSDVLTLEFEPAPHILSRVLTFCDMTTGPDGELVPVERRLAQIHHRYGSGHLVSRSIQRATPMILRAVDQVSCQLARQDLVHDLGTSGDHWPELATIHDLRGAGACVPDEAGDFLHGHAGVGHEADE